MNEEWKMIWWRRRSAVIGYISSYSNKLLIKFSWIHWSFWLFYYLHLCDFMKCIRVEARNVQRYESVQNQQPSNRKSTHQFFLSLEKWNARPRLIFLWHKYMRNACKAFDKNLFWIYTNVCNVCVCVFPNHVKKTIFFSK